MLGARIAMLRRDRKMSQGDLAGALGVSPSTVGMYEQGRREPSAAIIVALARLFQVSTDYLLTGKPNAAETETIRNLLQNRLSEHQTRTDGFTAQELAVLLAAMLTGP